MGNKLFGNVRTQLVGTLIATIGGIALAACSSKCGCNTCTPVYKKPCCAQSGGGGYSCGARTTPTYTQPGTTTMPPPKSGGGQMACGAGKCG